MKLTVFFGASLAEEGGSWGLIWQQRVSISHQGFPSVIIGIKDAGRIPFVQKVTTGPEGKTEPRFVSSQES